MSPTDDFGAIPEPVRKAAADWFARMHGPEASASRPAFEAWLAVPTNRHAYERLTARWDQSAFIGATETGRARRLRRASFVRRHPAVAAAAAILMLAGASGLLVTCLDRGSSRQVASRVAAPQRIEASGAVRTMVLADGSRVSLDNASLLLVAYTGARRDLVLARGRARFEVAHEKRPFIVTAANSEVIAHGTVFDVAVRGDVATVTLLKGAISVRRQGSATAARQLRTGEQIIVSAHRPLPLPLPAPADSASWLPEMIEFHDTPLAEAADRLAGEGMRIRFGADTGSLRITGAFRRGDVRALADGAVAMFGLRLDQTPSGDLLLTRPQGPAKKNGG